MVITGFLVDGATGGVKRDAGWARVLFLAPWREGEGGPVRTGQLRVELPPGAEETKRPLPGLGNGTWIDVQVEAVEPPSPRGWWNAVGAREPRPFTPDEPLEAARQALARPVVLVDLVLGRLTLDRRFGWFEGRCRRPGLSCRVTVERTETEEDPASDQRDVDAAREAVLMLERRLPDLLAAAVGELLPVWNDRWSDGSAPIDAEAMRRRLVLDGVELSASLHTLWLEAGDLFGDHGVEVGVSPEGEFLWAGLAG